MNHLKLNLFSAKHVCMYQINPFGWKPISSIFFPNTTHLSLIDCNPYGISDLLRPEYFPKLERIYYLSGKPHITTIHRRFKHKIKWVFPNHNYHFYNCMTEAGFGEKSNDLILSYILHKKIVNGVIHFDINLPDYGPICGAYYRSLLYNYIEGTPISETLHNVTNTYTSQQYTSQHRNTCHPVQLYQRYQLELEFMKHITLQN